VFQVILTPQALADLERLEAFLWDSGDPLASQLLDFVLDGMAVLTHQPAVGRPVGHRHRELIISRGRGGYLARYVLDTARPHVIVLGVRHQREAGYNDNEI
jgi:plasmid stabilization system protein ParE